MAKAPLGQNFLVDATAIERIVAALGDVSGACVVEIGPGGGALTRLLAKRAGRLVAVEFDAGLAAELRRQYDGDPNVAVMQGDIRATNFAALCAPGKCSVIGNLPYYITSDILLHLVAQQAVIDTAVVMMQREVAERVAASPGSRDYGVLSVTMQMAAEVEMLFTLPPEAFQPPPQVHSSVLRLRMMSRYEELGVVRAPFEKFVRGIFAQKRKTLAANLRNMGLAREVAVKAMEQCGIAEKSRAEELSVATLAQLYRALPL